MKFADKATVNILAKTMGSVLLMVSSIIMTRYLSKELYGTFLQAMLIVNTVLMLSMVGLPQSIYYYFQWVGDRKGFIYRNVLLSLAIGGAAAALVLILGDGICRLLGNPQLKGYLPYVAALVLLQSPLGFREPIFFSSGALLANSASSLCGSVIDYLPMFCAVLAGCGLKQILSVYLASKAVNLVLFFALLKRWCLDPVPAAPVPGGKEVRVMDQVRYALPIGAAGYLSVMGAQADKYIVSNGFNAAQFAVYSRGAMEVPFISTITYLLNDLTLPRYVAAYQKNDVRQLLSLMHANIDKVAKINFGVFAFLFVNADLLMEVLYTRQYLDAAPIFRITLMSLIFGVTVYNMIPTVTGNTRMLFGAVLSSTILKIVLCCVLLRYLGPVGVALGVLAGSLLSLSYLLVCSIRILKVRLSQIMPWASVARIALVAGGAGTVIHLCHAFGSPLGHLGNLTTVSLNFLLFSYLYLWGLQLAGMVGTEDRDFLKRWLRVDPFSFMPRRRIGAGCLPARGRR